MSQTFDDTNRQILPRWYPFGIASQLGDLEPVAERETPKISSPMAFAVKAEEWRQKRTLAHALDVVGTALVSGAFHDHDGREAAGFVSASAESEHSLGRQIAESYLRGGRTPTPSQVDLPFEELANRATIAHLRALTRRFPRSPIVWADLAYRYALAGEKSKSVRSMDIAVFLAPDNRFILRSAARCFLHLDQADKSLYYLRRSPLSRRDPWLISPEVAISESLGRSSRLIRAGRTIIGDANLSPWAINELVATLSTLEARHGSARKAKKLIPQALQDPNENTVAQIEWLGVALRQEVARPSQIVVATYEADARRSLRAGEFEQALGYAKGWCRFQPFASRPVILASYIAAVCLQDDEEALAILERAEATAPDSFLIKNNHAFSLASLNRVADAAKVQQSIDQASLRARERSTFAATRGLIEFRKGDLQEGRRLYAKAISDLKNVGDYRGATIATLFLAREELRVSSPVGEAVLSSAREMALSYEVKEAVRYADTLARQG
ncbi:MAG: hypothetical protein KJ970_09695 [Candidatus Eisenbacteria bacterium]|uniref:Tetratricopeptide repeat protein n=1 Tax=Eiseniibacteriota bacterium TaxID=2212470 RepID=A0A948W3K3_UNCEI|nr:hypothetical protein [Candidatus Eisenbacteria bacterium]MBU2691192.1 hypothetical protein [Candidatus Eisenbacteria bacterium]